MYLSESYSPLSSPDYLAGRPGASGFFGDVPELSAIHGVARSTPRDIRRHPVGGRWKRGLDILIAGGALLALSPVLLTVALLVKMESKGPALFVQRRGGFRGRVFLIYKFRTMTSLDDDKVVAQATREDSRITRVGAFLRRTSIDELPQLLNVLRGEMSIVGPRPHAVAHDIAFAQRAPQYRKRTAARPGITGLAQVSGSRGNLESDQDLELRVEKDIQYINTWSMRLDVSIIVRTARLVVSDPNAY